MPGWSAAFASAKALDKKCKSIVTWVTHIKGQNHWKSISKDQRVLW